MAKEELTSPKHLILQLKLFTRKFPKEMSTPFANE